jgi:electron transport complex protein RnfG
MTQPVMPHGGPPPPAPPAEVPAGRLLATLAAAGAAAGFLIVVVYGWASPIILRNKARALQEAIQEVLEHPARYDTLYRVGGALAAALPAGADPKTAERVYVGYGADGRPVGYAIAAGEPGFQDVIELIFGYDPSSGKLLGMKVLESRETPGLGDKIEKDSAFVRQFRAALAPLVGVKPDRHTPGDAHQVDMITGATISSRAVIRIINHAVERWGPLLAAYRPGTTP